LGQEFSESSSSSASQQMEAVVSLVSGGQLSIWGKQYRNMKDRPIFFVLAVSHSKAHKLSSPQRPSAQLSLVSG